MILFICLALLNYYWFLLMIRRVVAVCGKSDDLNNKVDPFASNK